ncbi:OsmC family protein [Archaeoglobus veneficus]|uniref:OsmC family protein n=1 Tax=Archaeoglobus veneficus (strain DSM 11195 / SNP6) TaxID=693661 RepID=F2KQJ2_ARCVS|nr:OsmC family protein [Archaeoglobus veneficus]AEA47725.1 OsmC family protein [Archaeoglobus veneficus SNP6]
MGKHACCASGGESEVTVKWIEKFQFVGTAREHSVVIDQKVDEGGDNTGFKPTELLLTSLGGCMGTTILTIAKLQGIEITELRLDVKVERLCGDVEWKFTVNVHIDGKLSQEDKEKLIKAAEETCKISSILRCACEVRSVF